MRRWLVLLGCFVGMAVSISATLTFSFGLYLESMTREFGWSRTQFASTLSFFSLGNIVMLPVAGYVADRIGPSRSIMVGLLSSCGALAAIAGVHSYSAFVLMSCVASMAGALALYPAYFQIVRGWFDRNLGLALAIASAGVSAGVAVFARLITVIIDLHGWRSAFVASAAVALVVGLANLALLVGENGSALPPAEQMGDRDEGALEGASLAEALRTADFWLFSVAFLLIVFAGSGPQVHLPALLTDKGVPSGAIATVVAALAAGSVAGRIVTGALLDRLSFRIVAALFFLGQGAGILVLLWEPSLAIASALLMGGALGAELDIMGFVLARRFGRVAYSRVLGAGMAVAQSALLISPVGTGLIYDRYRSYDLVLCTYPLLSVAAVIIISFARTSRPSASPFAGTGPRMMS